MTSGWAAGDSENGWMQMPMIDDARYTYAVVWPRAKKSVELQSLAERLDTLQGKTVAHVWDYMIRGDEIFPILQQGLSERYPGIKFVNYETFGSTHGDQEHAVLAGMPEKLRRFGVGAVISGMAC
ncbi:MAG: hypothetical protein IID61_11835 [SAR324 cluster bacterium]|nr:hypothetical protein [SAR324 cluster bacterium]